MRLHAEEMAAGKHLTVSPDSTLEAAHRKQTKGFSRRDEDDEDGKVLVKEDSPFHAVKFHRVILDEAHNIKVILALFLSVVVGGHEN